LYVAYGLPRDGTLQSKVCLNQGPSRTCRQSVFDEDVGLASIAISK
jgi:hypothetical protein